jgi:hypothetical protein
MTEKLSFKNILQERFQKSGMKPPIYNTYRQGGTDHAPIFISELELPTGEFFIGQPAPSKKEAERIVADAALISMDPIEEKQSEITLLHAEEPVLVLIDIENVSKDFDTIAQGSNVDIVGYVGKNHHLAHVAHTNTPQVIPYKLKIVPSALPDAVDTQIICDCTRACDKNYYEKIIVVTKDHYGDCLCAIFEKVQQCGSIEKLKLFFTQ